MKNNKEFIKAYNFTPVLKDYDWGSLSGIQNIIKRDDLKGNPLAELWMGSHKNGDGLVSVSNDKKINLSEFIKTDCNAILGKPVSKKYSAELPFLFKILAAEKPLSIQVHPSKKEAEKGFDNEEKEKIDISAYNRTYKDRNHKPELIYTLTDFYLLKGFRECSDIYSNLRAFSPLFIERAEREKKLATIEKLFKYLLSIDKNNLHDIIDQTLSNCKKYNGLISDTINNFYSVYGYDSGVLAPLFLNILKLKPHSALFIPAGELHSYISGIGFEIMANSDNVLRGGLTTKYIDVKGLFEVGNFKKSSMDKGITLPKTDKNVEKYITKAGEFTFSVISLDKGNYSYEKSRKNFELYFYIGNECKVTFPAENSSYNFKNGDSFIIPACAFPYIINGDGILYMASVNI
ncbi:MAG: mannose-6-phosphate isomerase, class I [Spirochaetaceae bacterium]|nr:mannose-6-phosphate isomerase, class I [Spirochaetaceae bacterium]